MKREKTLITDATKGPLFKQFVFFAIPIILANILQSTYLIIDTIIVGKFLGSNGLSAIGIGSTLQFLLFALGMGITFGGQILLSQYVGAGDHESIRKGIGTFLTLTIPSALLVGLLGFVFQTPLLHVMNTPAEIFATTRSYFLTYCVGLIFIYGYLSISALLRGIGETRLPMIFAAVATVLNIALDYIFVGILGMDAGSTALATVIAQGFSFLLAVVYLYMHRDALGFDFHLSSFRMDLKIASALFKLSWPIFVFGLVMSFSSMFISSNVNVYGVAASAADGIGTKLCMIGSSIAMGLNMAGVAITSQCFGAGKIQRISKTFRITLYTSLVVWACIAALSFFFPVQLFGIFTNDKTVLAFAPQYMHTYILFMFGIAMAGSACALFEGVGKPSLEMIAGIIENIGRIFLCMILGNLLGLTGYWLSRGLSALITPIFGFIYYFSGRWKKRKPSWADNPIEIEDTKELIGEI